MIYISFCSNKAAVNLAALNKILTREESSKNVDFHVPAISNKLNPAEFSAKSKLNFLILRLSSPATTVKEVFNLEQKVSYETIRN
jgi:hypothetical protein